MRNIVNFRKFKRRSKFWKFIERSNVAYLGFIKLRKMTFFSFSRDLSSFPYHIFHVICMCTKPKMSRINTRRIIAGMAYAHSFGYFRFMDYPRDAMSIRIYSMKKKLSVSVGMDSSNPSPTFFFFANVFKKSFLNILSAITRPAFFGPRDLWLPARTFSVAKNHSMFIQSIINGGQELCSHG